MNNTTLSINENKASRITFLDLMRGVVMILMTLDHVRTSFAIQAQFFWGKISPLGAINPALAFPDTTMLLFYLRWITNFCAPFFVFLAGISIFLWRHKKGSEVSASKYLFTRGLWVICANFIVSLPAPLLSTPYFNLGVLWAIGLSMIFMSFIIHLPKKILWTLGISIVVGHNFLSEIRFSISPFAELWSIAFYPSEFSLPISGYVFVQYPLIAWFGLMLVGYTCGSIFLIQKNRCKTFFTIGLVLLFSFVILRSFQLYGDANLWIHYTETWKNIASFLNTTKYPPSLQYLLFNISILFIGFSIIEKYTIRSKILLTLGCTPMVFYITHFLGARAMGVLVGKYTGPFNDTIKAVLLTPVGTIFSSFALVLALYPVCFFWKYRKLPWQQ